MSFSATTKNELSRAEPEKKCCKLAEIAGFIRMCGTIKLSGGGKLSVMLLTENQSTYIPLGQVHRLANPVRFQLFFHRRDQCHGAH